MIIAIIVHNLTGGGAERVAALWAEGFARKGHKVVVVIHNENSPVTYKLSQNVNLRLCVSHLSNKILRTLDRIRILHNILCKEKPNIVIDVMPDFWKRIAMIGVNSIKISTEHWSFERPQNATVQPQKIKKIYLNSTYDCLTVLTQADKDVIGNQLKNVFVLPNPLAFVPIDKIEKREKVVLAMGRLDAGYTKGFDVLIEAFSIAKSDWSLQIAGAGNVKSLEQYKKIAKECGVEKQVEFLGFVDNPIKLFQRASVFVLSSRYEAFGLVLIEAMSQGCACIACDYKGRQGEIIISPEQGILCEPDNVESLSKALAIMFNDEVKRESMRKFAVERAKDFSVDKIADKWEEIFKIIQ